MPLNKVHAVQITRTSNTTNCFTPNQLPSLRWSIPSQYALNSVTLPGMQGNIYILRVVYS